MENFNLEDFAIRKYDPELYDRLTEEYYDISSKYIKNLFWGRGHTEYHREFRKWLIDEYRCWPSDSYTLYFKTEEDYVWFELRHG